MKEVLNFIKIHFYYLEQYINKLIIHDLSKTTILIFILIFISGVFSSLNPCSISILPVAISYINNDIKIKHNYRKEVFIAGTISSFILIIIFTSLFQAFILSIPIIYSTFMICLGLSLLEIIQFNFMTFNIKYRYSYLIKDYITGFIVGLNSSSCSTPILSTIIFWISQSKSTGLGIIYSICYLLGYTLPLLFVIQITINYAALLNFKHLWNYLIPISGSIMLGLGTLSLFHSIFI